MQSHNDTSFESAQIALPTSKMSTTHGIKVLQKLRNRNCIEVAPFVDIIELNNRLIVANSQLLSEREEIQFVNVKLKFKHYRSQGVVRL